MGGEGIFFCNNRPGKVPIGSSLLLFLDIPLPLRKDRRFIIVTALGPESYRTFIINIQSHGVLHTAMHQAEEQVTYSCIWSEAK